MLTSTSTSNPFWPTSTQLAERSCSFPAQILVPSFAPTTSGRGTFHSLVISPATLSLWAAVYSKTTHILQQCGPQLILAPQVSRGRVPLKILLLLIKPSLPWSSWPVSSLGNQSTESRWPSPANSHPCSPSPFTIGGALNCLNFSPLTLSGSFGMGRNVHYDYPSFVDGAASSCIGSSGSVASSVPQSAVSALSA